MASGVSVGVGSGVASAVASGVASRVASDPEAYKYLADSTMAWPDQPSFADRIVKAGFRKVAWRNLAGGAVAMHRGFK